MTNRGGGRCRGAKVSRRSKVESTLGQVANTANTENMKTTAAIQGQKGNRQSGWRQIMHRSLMKNTDTTPMHDWRLRSEQ